MYWNKRLWFNSHNNLEKILALVPFYFYLFTMKKNLKNFVIDVDGVMTTGHFIYTSAGKVMKIFGPDDNDALKLISQYLTIHFVTGDSRGFDISQRRIEHDMGQKLDLVSTVGRIDWIKSHYDVTQTVYMGDGIFDHYVMSEVAYSIAPSNGDRTAQEAADYVTERSGGDRAVAEAVLHLLSTFFEPYDATRPLPNNLVFSGRWKT